MVWFRVTTFVAVSTALSCGSSSGRDSLTAVTGTVAGVKVPTTDAVAVVAPLVETFGGFTQQGVTVVISNKSDLCSIGQSSVDLTPPDSTFLYIIVGTPEAVTPGTYPITANVALETTDNAAVVFRATDAQCKPMSNNAARHGTISLSDVGATTIGGTFDVTLDTGENLSGAFRAPVCATSMNTDAAVQTNCGS